MSCARVSWPLRFIASKNIFWDGYIQFPVASSEPVSCSWLDGRLVPGYADVAVLGIVETSRSVSRPDLVGAGGARIGVFVCVVGADEVKGM